MSRLSSAFLDCRLLYALRISLYPHPSALDLAYLSPLHSLRVTRLLRWMCADIPILRSLAAYGIDPTEARAAPENTEDGGVEEDDLEDGEDSEDDEEDVKLVFGNQGTHLDLR